MDKTMICLIAVEIIALVKLARELKKSRCLFDLLTSGIILVIVNYVTWTL